MHSALLVTPVLVFLLLLAFVVPVVLRLLRPCRMSEVTPEWLDSFQTSTYYPMRGLFAADDFRFLSSQPGYDPSLVRKLRSDRLRIFRQYLDRLVLDFNRLHRYALVMVASNTDQDQSDLFVYLIKLRVRFSMAVIRVEFCYLLCRFGWRSLAVTNLLARLEELSSLCFPPRTSSASAAF